MSSKAALGAASRTDIYTDPLRETYTLWTIFTMPANGGGRLGVAVPFKVGMYLTSLNTLLITGIFYFIWQFITYIILMSSPGRPAPIDDQAESQAESQADQSRANRDITLISVWNSGNPWTAMVPLLKHTWRMFFTVKDTATGRLDIIILLLTVAATLSNWGASVYVPGNLTIGNAAPANPLKVFFPIQPYILPNSPRIDRIILQSIQAPAAQRALGTVEAASKRLKDRVTVSRLEAQITYNYSITGVDLGLQHASGLLNMVEGACTLEYGWWNGSSNDTLDIYNCPLVSSQVILRLDSLSPPTAFMSNSGNKSELDSGNITYGIIFDTVNRRSVTPSVDPMYSTNQDGTLYVVARGRPALYCWQTSNWAYNGHNITDVTKLGEITGQDLPEVLRNFIIFSFIAPRIVLYTQSLGPAALISSAASVQRNINAGIAHWQDDIERLINAAFISSINIFRDATMSTKLQEFNITVQPAANLTKGAGDFILYSGEVITLSLKTIIAIPAVFLLLCCIRGAFWLAKITFKDHSMFTDFNRRIIDLEATQVYRLYYEAKYGTSEGEDWQGRRGRVPYVMVTNRPSQNRDSNDSPDSMGGSKALGTNGTEVKVESVPEGREISDLRAV